MTRLNRSDENNLLAALRHPLRRQILRLIANEEATSPRELSVVLETPLSNVSYHVRVLVDCEAVALVREIPVRGSVQHFYRNAVDAPWALAILGLREAGSDGTGESSAD